MGFFDKLKNAARKVFNTGRRSLPIIQSVAQTLTPVLMSNPKTAPLVPGIHSGIGIANQFLNPTSRNTMRIDSPRIRLQ